MRSIPLHFGRRQLRLKGPLEPNLLGRVARAPWREPPLGAWPTASPHPAYTGWCASVSTPLCVNMPVPRSGTDTHMMSILGAPACSALGAWSLMMPSSPCTAQTTIRRNRGAPAVLSRMLLGARGAEMQVRRSVIQPAALSLVLGRPGLWPKPRGFGGSQAPRNVETLMVKD